MNKYRDLPYKELIMLLNEYTKEAGGINLRLFYLDKEIEKIQSELSKRNA